MTCNDLPRNLNQELCDNLGCDKQKEFAITENGDPYDLTSATIKLYIRNATTNALVWDVPAANIVVTNAEGGIVRIDLTDAAKVTAAIAAGEYKFFLTVDGKLAHGGDYNLGVDVSAP
jgi:hypothetical protein